LAFDASRALAIRARVLNHASGAATNMTGPRDGEESLLVTNLPGTGPGRPLFPLTPRRSTRSLARIARPKTWDTKLRGHASGRFFERDFKIVAKVCAALRRRPARACATAAKLITK